MTAKIEVKYPLPGNPPRAIWLSDALDDVLATYTLTESGRLMRTDYRAEGSDNTLPTDASYDYLEQKKKALLSGRWPLELVSTAIMDTGCHGSWTFWAMVYKMRGGHEQWQYQVRFEKGSLVSIEGGLKTD